MAISQLQNSPNTTQDSMNYQSPKAQANLIKQVNPYNYESPHAPVKASPPANSGLIASPHSFNYGLESPKIAQKNLQSPVGFSNALWKQDTNLETPPTRKESNNQGSDQEGAQAYLTSFDMQLTPEKPKSGFNELSTPPRHSN